MKCERWKWSSLCQGCGVVDRLSGLEQALMEWLYLGEDLRLLFQVALGFMALSHRKEIFPACMMGNTDLPEMCQRLEGNVLHSCHLLMWNQPFSMLDQMCSAVCRCTGKAVLVLDTHTTCRCGAELHLPQVSGCSWRRLCCPSYGAGPFHGDCLGWSSAVCKINALASWFSDVQKYLWR